jgi:hypothetical protein
MEKKALLRIFGIALCVSLLLGAMTLVNFSAAANDKPTRAAEGTDAQQEVKTFWETVKTGFDSETQTWEEYFEQFEAEWQALKDKYGITGDPWAKTASESGQTRKQMYSRIKATDATRVLLAVIGKIALDDNQRAFSDVNQDGKLNSNDATRMLLHIVGKQLIA